MTATAPAMDWMACTTGPVTALMRPCTACCASVTATFQMPTKKPPIDAPTPLPDGAVNVSALNTVLSTPWIKPDTSVHGALARSAGRAAGSMCCPPIPDRYAELCPPDAVVPEAPELAAITSETNSGRAIVGNTTAGASAQSWVPMTVRMAAAPDDVPVLTHAASK